MRRLLLALVLCVVAVALVPSAAGAVAGTPFEGDAMWVHEVPKSSGGDPERMARRASSSGMEWVVIKAAHGDKPWTQLTRELVDAFHARGLRVCAYQRALGLPGRFAREARVLAATVGLGVDCLVIDAEAEYEGKFRGAATYVRTLRAAVGPAFPVALTSFPYVDYHPRFPYSVFLGPGGAQVNLPQMYWRLIGTSVTNVFARTWTQNTIYGRPIHPIGQVFQSPRASEIRRFRRLAAARGATGASWWVWQFARGAHWKAVGDALPPVQPVTLTPGFAPLRPGRAGDAVRWLQTRLRVAGVAPAFTGPVAPPLVAPSPEALARFTEALRAMRITSRFDRRTAAAVVAFKSARGLPPTAAVDDATWLALLELAPADAVVPPRR